MSDHHYPPCSSCGGLAFHSQECSTRLEIHGSHGPAETQRHHLQRTELEALRAELAETARQALLFRDAVLALQVERGALHKDFADLELERQVVASERDTLRSRVQKLEGALKKLEAEATGFVGMASVEAHGRTNIAVLEHWILNARAALESGTEPIDPIGPIEKPIAPAPKTFTVELVDAAVEAATEAVSLAFEREERAISKGSPPYDRAFIRAILWDDVASAIRRALGLGEP